MKSLFSQFRKDLVTIWFSAIAALCIGFLINQFRIHPLSLTYQSKAERLETSVQRLASHTTDLAGTTLSQQFPTMPLEKFSDFVFEKQGLVLDARPEVFHRLGHVPGALNLPRDDFENAYTVLKQKLDADKAQAIVVYCSGDECEDSRLVSKSLRSLGYSNIAIYEGGWNEWSEAGKPIEKER